MPKPKQKSGAVKAPTDWSANFAVTEGMGYRSVWAVGSHKRLEDAVLEAVDSLGIPKGGMFAVKVTSIGVQNGQKE